MNRDKFASMITRLYLCNDSKLENIDKWESLKKKIMNLDDDEFSEELSKFGLLDKEAS